MATDYFEESVQGHYIHIYSFCKTHNNRVGLSVGEEDVELTYMEAYLIGKALLQASGRETMVESDRHTVICGICNLVYNESGNIKDVPFTGEDVVEIEQWLLELSKDGVLGFRIPTRAEVSTALFTVMEAKFIGN